MRVRADLISEKEKRTTVKGQLDLATPEREEQIFIEQRLGSQQEISAGSLCLSQLDDTRLVV